MKSLKQLIIAAVAFGVFLGTLGLESVFAVPVELAMKGNLALIVPSGQSVDVTHNGSVQTVNGDANQPLEAGDTVQVKSGTGIEVHFSDHGLVRLSDNALLGVDFLDPSHDAYVLNLKQGRAWANNIYTTATLNLVADGAYLIPDAASFDVNIDGQKTEVYANSHQVSVGLVPLNYQAKSAKLFPDSDLINSYILAEGNQTTVFADKITQDETTLRKLFYSKLVKEFPFGIIDPQVLTSDAWLKNNIQFDKTLASKIQADASQQIRSRGLVVADLNSFGYTFGQSLNHFYNFLTFSQPKVIDRTNNNIFDHFDDAKYLLLFGQTTKAQERLDFFKQSLDEALASQGDAYKAAALASLWNEYDELSYITPDDSLAPAKALVVNDLLAQIGDDENGILQKFLLVRNTMNGVYDLADKGSQSAGQALQDYFNDFTKLVGQEQSRLSGMSNILAEENQIMNNLLLQYPIFYRDVFFSMKNQLEQQWLALLPEGDGKNEEKQTIISTKIDFLNRLQTFFLADKITIDDAKSIVQRLFHEADSLQLPSDQQVAVNQLFDQRLQDFGTFYRYLSSPEYVATTLHGASRQDQFNQFVQAQQEQVSIDQIRQEILGNQTTTPTITTDQILAQAQQDFSAIGAGNVVFGTLSDVTQKLIPLNSAVVAGATIQGQYDWDNKLLSQIYAGDTLISTDPVALNNLALLIQTKLQQQQQAVQPTPQPVPQPSPSPSPSPSSNISKTELVAKVLLIQKLKTYDIGVTQDAVTIDDLSNSLFTVSSAILISDQSITFSFDVDGKNNIVTNLAVQILGGSKPVSGTLNLSDVSAQVKAAVQAGNASP